MTQGKGISRTCSPARKAAIPGSINRLSIAAALLGVLSFLFSEKAHAYLDPGSGSYILQILIAALLGASVGIKIYWKRIKHMLRSTFSGEKGDEEGDD
jgi:hypothetical protein